MAEINLLEHYPKSTRPIEERAKTVTAADRQLSKQFGRDYFDGDRRHGYGGYRYHPRFWQLTVKRFRDHYQLAEDAHILDVGCAKGFMLRDFKELMPKATIAGLDCSEYAIQQADEAVKPFVQMGNAVALPYSDHSFDLVVSINTLHNLSREACQQALLEIQRVTSAHAFVMVDAWRTERERELQRQWMLTAETYMHVDDWKRLFTEIGFTGDYYWCILE